MGAGRVAAEMRNKYIYRPPVASDSPVSNYCSLSTHFAHLWQNTLSGVTHSNTLLTPYEQKQKNVSFDGSLTLTFACWLILHSPKCFETLLFEGKASVRKI
jgi:hypothetical protein